MGDSRGEGRQGKWCWNYTNKHNLREVVQTHLILVPAMSEVVMGAAPADGARSLPVTGRKASAEASSHPNTYLQTHTHTHTKPVSSAAALRRKTGCTLRGGWMALTGLECEQHQLCDILAWQLLHHELVGALVTLGKQNRGRSMTCLWRFRCNQRHR